MAFVAGVVVEVVKPFFVDGEMMAVGDMVEMPERDARESVARKQVRLRDEAGAGRAAKGAARGRAA